MTPATRKAFACLYYAAPPAPDTLRGLAEACLRLSSQVALRIPDAVFVETGGSRLLYSDAGMRARLEALGQRFHGAGPSRRRPSGRNPPPGAGAPLPLARLGLGAHAGEALARAKYAPLGPDPHAWPLEALNCYASPFGEDAEVRRRLEPLIGALRALGVAGLGGFLDLPALGWGERFGPHAAVLRERLEGRMTVGWPRFEPTARLKEGGDLRDAETQSAGPTDEALRFHLKRLCDRVAARLRGRGKRAARLSLELRFERVAGLLDQAPRALDLKLALPVAEPSQLQGLLRELLESEVRRRPLPRPLAGLALEVTDTAPGFAPQRDLFDRREEAVEAQDGLVARLVQRLGESGVFRARLVPRHDPERAWRRETPSSPGPLPGPRNPEAGAGGARGGAPDPGVPPTPRPTRMLRRPLLLARNGDWLVYWGGGGKARRWRTRDWTGPERIAGEWWRPAPDSGPDPGPDPNPNQERPGPRDYWRVGTDEGMDLWLFCRPGEESRGGALWLRGWWG